MSRLLKVIPGGKTAGGDKECTVDLQDSPPEELIEIRPDGEDAIGFELRIKNLSMRESYSLLKQSLWLIEDRLRDLEDEEEQ